MRLLYRVSCVYTCVGVVIFGCRGYRCVELCFSRRFEFLCRFYRIIGVLGVVYVRSGRFGEEGGFVGFR